MGDFSVVLDFIYAEFCKNVYCGAVDQNYRMAFIYITLMDILPSKEVYEINSRLLRSILQKPNITPSWPFDTDQVLEDLHDFRCIFRETIKDSYPEYNRMVQQKRKTISDNIALERFLINHDFGHLSKFIINKLEVESMEGLKSAVNSGLFDPKLTQSLKDASLWIIDVSVKVQTPPSPLPSVDVIKDYSCVICAVNAPNTVFIPCKHMACHDCFPQLKKCHMCNAAIEGSLKVFV
tara:strand:+ start:35868 stop:36575 length:708 start_codon:yes stop_codon:yes gene_type:complete